MRLATEPTEKLFHGVCPSCGTEGLAISGSEREGSLSCPNCEWDSSLPVEVVEKDSGELMQAG